MKLNWKRTTIRGKRSYVTDVDGIIYVIQQPLAPKVWHHYRADGRDTNYLVLLDTVHNEVPHTSYSTTEAKAVVVDYVEKRRAFTPGY